MKTTTSSAEEFEKWKRWSDENYHAIEKADHRHSNRTISLEGLAELSFAVLSAETEVMDQYDQEERGKSWINTTRRSGPACAAC